MESQIQVLTDVHERLQAIRHIPSLLLKSSTSDRLSSHFQLLGQFTETLRSDAVQDALRVSSDSFKANSTDLNPHLRREIHKRRRPPSPESPRPYVPVEEKSRSLFPPAFGTTSPLDAKSLSVYIREFNTTHHAKLHLWARSHGAPFAGQPIIVRFTIPDIVTAYLTLVTERSGGALLTESVTTFGPRERKAPHSQSEFTVYRLLSQQIGKMLESDPDARVESVVDVLSCYSGLFTERCGRCERVLTTEGHVPAVMRVWMEGCWEARRIEGDDRPHNLKIGNLAMSLQDYQVYPTSPIHSTMRPPDVVVSPAGIIHVLGYTPTEGEPGAPISVRIHFNPEFSDAIYVRLVLDAKPVPTTVRELHDTSYGRWQLDTLAPPFDRKVFPSPKVLVSVQALDRDKNVLDTATFGEFAYWTPGSSPSACRERPLAHHKPKLHINTNNPRPSQNVTFRRQGSSHIPTPSPTSPGASRSVPSTCKSQVQLHRRTKPDSMTRHKNGKHISDPHVQTPILDLVTSLQDICAGWTSAEVSVGRRLVRFTKVQDGRRLIVSCEPIKVEDYRDSDSVISCIYREESETCYVTSVDIIFLLERLTNSDFPVEEKNRIRRNLEGLRPTTVSKHKHGFEDFFQRIMEFPDPKPRNIEKDLKVFEWSLLDQALDKILSKYTVDTSAVSVEDSESSEPSASSSSDDPDYRQQLAYPPAKPENPYVPDDNPATALGSVRPPSSSASSKFEHIQEEFHFLTSSEDSLCSPLQPPPSYPIYSAEVAHHQASGSSSGSWGSDYKHNDSIIEQFSPYEVAQHTGQVINYTEIDFNAYESLAFHSSIPGETLDMADNPYI